MAGAACGGVTPPQPPTTEAASLNKNAPPRARFLTLQGRLDALRRQASAGHLDSVDVRALRGLVDELRATRDAYAAARGSGRLYRHHSMMVRSVNLAMGSAEMLTQACQMIPSEIRTSFLARSTAHRQEAERLENAAADAYSQALPIVVS